jgi:tRNA 2-thiouridine synthesizing protein A
VFHLNLKGTPCPINFVRTKIKLEAMNCGESLELILDDGEAIVSVSQSIIEEGQEIISKVQNSDLTWTLVIKKLV